MERCKRILHKILFPGLAVVLAMALYMIFHATGQLKQVRNAETSEQEDLR